MTYQYITGTFTKYLWRMVEYGKCVERCVDGGRSAAVTAASAPEEWPYSDMIY